MMADADSVNGILAGGEYLWDRCKNLRGRLIFREVFTEWTTESARSASSPVVLQSRKYDVRTGLERSE